LGPARSIDATASFADNLQVFFSYPQLSMLRPNTAISGEQFGWRNCGSADTSPLGHGAESFAFTPQPAGSCQSRVMVLVEE